MVQPLRAGPLLLVLLAPGLASAAPLPQACRAGLVLGVDEHDAEDVVAAVCASAKRGGVPWLVRVSVLGAGGRFRVAVAHRADSDEVEEAAHADAASVAEAVRIAPAFLEAIVATPPSERPPVSERRVLAPAPAPAPSPSPSPDARTPLAAEEPAQRPRPLPMKPAVMLGVHGSSGIAAGGAGFGGGASIGLDHRIVAGFIDYSRSAASASPGFEHDLLALGVRVKLGQSALQPVVGGGWSWADYAAPNGTGRTTGTGLGMFGEGGAIYTIERHRLMALARLNLGLFDEQTTTPYTYRSYDGRAYPSTMTRSGDGSFATSFALLAGYAYVFR